MVGVLAHGLLSEPEPSEQIGLSATDFALGTLYDLHSGADSAAVQRGIAVTLAQMYIDAEGRDEQARQFIKSMANQVPVLAEEIEAIEKRRKETEPIRGDERATRLASEHDLDYSHINRAARLPLMARPSVRSAR